MKYDLAKLMKEALDKNNKYLDKKAEDKKCDGAFRDFYLDNLEEIRGCIKECFPPVKIKFPYYEKVNSMSLDSLTITFSTDSQYYNKEEGQVEKEYLDNFGKTFSKKFRDNKKGCCFGIKRSTFSATDDSIVITLGKCVGQT